MKRNISIILMGALLAGCLLIAGCGCGSGSSGDSAASSDASSQSIFTFRDVLGNSYEAYLDMAAALCPYDESLFVVDGSDASYEDDTYTSWMGVDVSYHQGDIDWETVRADGYTFAIIRVGYRGYGEEGSLNEDEKFAEYAAQAKAAGLKVGFYFFSQAINEDEALEEAQFVISLLEREGLDPELPVFFDPENISDDEARTDDVSGEQFTANAKIFCETIENSGYDSGVYANMYWEAYTLDMGELADYTMWYADYESIPQSPYAFSFWQYSESSSVSGISTECDTNLWIMKK
ncbi:MAG: glycoside hydrolase family 25 protein [Eubacterium sp.]|nr:glycoside hydrolase family 25 protein [Eubacterium sp.]